MSLTIALSQISKPSWWNDPPEPWQTNRKRLAETSEQRDLLLASIQRKRTPKTMAELADENDCTVAKIRSLVAPFIESGVLVRGVNADGKVTIAKAPHNA